MECDDIIWVAFYSIVPVFIFQSVIIFLLCLVGSYAYYGIFKQRKPRGWLLGWIYLEISPSTYIAVLERKEHL